MEGNQAKDTWENWFWEAHFSGYYAWKEQRKRQENSKKKTLKVFK